MRLLLIVCILGLSVILFSGCTSSHSDTRTLLNTSKRSFFKPTQQLYYARAVNQSFFDTSERAIYDRFMLFSSDIRSDDVCKKLEVDGRRLYARGYWKERQFLIYFVKILMMNGVLEEAQILIRHHGLQCDEML